MGDSEVEVRSAEQLVSADTARDGSPPAFSSGEQLRRYDSLDLEAASHPHRFSKGRDKDSGTVMRLAFQSVGIVYGEKYVFIVLRANDNGDGGTFALYSLICRYATVGLLPSQQTERGIQLFAGSA